MCPSFLKELQINNVDFNFKNNYDIMKNYYYNKVSDIIDYFKIEKDDKNSTKLICLKNELDIYTKTFFIFDKTKFVELFNNKDNDIFLNSASRLIKQDIIPLEDIINFKGNSKTPDLSKIFSIVIEKNSIENLKKILINNFSLFQLLYSINSFYS